MLMWLPDRRLLRSRMGLGGVAVKAIALLLIFACTSCVVVPLAPFTNSPYRPEVIQKLSQAEADKNLVRQTLGTPKWVLANGNTWIYVNSHPTWGIIGGTSSAVVTDDEWLAVQFDNAGRVVFIESNEMMKCLSNGMCLDGTAPTSQDQPAKSYQARAGECAVYLFLNPLPWPLQAGAVKFLVDGKAVGTVNSKTYLFLTHLQGDIRIAAYDLDISTHCVGGEKLYVRAVKKQDWSWKTGEDLAPVDAKEGEAAIRARALAMPD